MRSPLPTSPTTALYQLGATAARQIPLPLSIWLAKLAAAPLSVAMDSSRLMVERHQARALRFNTGTATLIETRQRTRTAFESYARYWLESFRLPAIRPAALDRGIDATAAFAKIEVALTQGNGVIIALPHLGGWEWAGFWLARRKHRKVNVVVESLDPPELFEWFASFRRSLGMNVIALGPEAGTEALAALKRNEIVCLLSDRNIGGDGVEVEFLGETTRLPAGPAVLAMRSGAPILPAAVYFTERGGHHAQTLDFVDTTRQAKLREDAVRITQRLADALATLICTAPQQWHLFGPNWPSDLAQQPVPNQVPDKAPSPAL